MQVLATAAASNVFGRENYDRPEDSRGGRRRAQKYQFYYMLGALLGGEIVRGGTTKPSRLTKSEIG
jgi:hypothetical protein